MKAPDLCDVCGRDVPAGQGVRAEMAVSGAMCPTPMAFHDECYETAQALWQPGADDPDSTCTVDPLFPETAQWTGPDAPS